MIPNEAIISMKQMKIAIFLKETVTFHIYCLLLRIFVVVCAYRIDRQAWNATYSWRHY